MNRSLRTFSMLGLATLAFAAACDDSSTGGSPETTTPPVANPPPGTTAPTPGTTTPTPPPAPETGVKVTVVRGGKPVAGARVVFHDETGAIVGTPFTTDANGVVDQPTAPKQLTVIVNKDIATPAPDFVTYTSVEEGDRFVVDASPYYPADDVANPSYLVTLAGERQNATNYQAVVSRTCVGSASASAPQPLEVSNACLGPQNSVLATAYDDANTLGFSWKKGLPSPTAPNTPVTLEAWADPTNLTLSIQNLAAVEGTRSEALAIAGGMPFVAYHAPGDAAATGYHFPMPPAAFADGGYQAAFIETYTSSDDRYGWRGLVKRAPAGNTMALDYEAMLPKFTLAQLDATTDPDRPSMTWTTERPLTGKDAADVGWVRFDWFSDEEGPNRAYHTWTFVVPASATSVKAPELPAPEAEISPGAVNTQGPGFSGVVIGESSLGAYREAKKLPVGTSYNGFGDLGFALPADGTMRVTTAYIYIGIAPPGT